MQASKKIYKMKGMAHLHLFFFYILYTLELPSIFFLLYLDHSFAIIKNNLFINIYGFFQGVLEHSSMSDNKSTDEAWNYLAKS